MTVDRVAKAMSQGSATVRGRYPMIGVRQAASAIVGGALLAASAIAGSSDASAQISRDYVSVIGPRATYPYVAEVVERFGRTTRFKYPRADTTETAAAFKLLCGGTGPDYPDVALATRPMEDSEQARCSRNDVSDVITLHIGFDTIVLTMARGPDDPDPPALSTRHLFLALAARVPDPTAEAGSGDAAAYPAAALTLPMIENPYRRWPEIDPALPDVPIRFALPPVTATANDILVQGVMAKGCAQVETIKALGELESSRQAELCATMREDAVIERLNVPAEELVSILEERGPDGALALLRPQDIAGSDGLTAVAIDGIAPDRPHIMDYPATRPLYLIVKPDHVDLIPGLREFVAEVMNPFTSGPSGYLTRIGLVPLPEEARVESAARATNLVAVPDPAPATAEATEGTASPQARLRRIENALWQNVRGSDDPDTIRTYLSMFPNGMFASRAERRIALLNRRDADGDGVPDHADQCADTGADLPVDDRGCVTDADGDGVPDPSDTCPETPEGTVVDETGCPADGDGDGVSDPVDSCPRSQKGEVVDEAGCGPDEDGDGVPDTADACAASPAGAIVDETGCPVDSDGDGVDDATDACPKTATALPVDATGCPIDTDGDGVDDATDACPDTPAGQAVEPTGCAETPPTHAPQTAGPMPASRSDLLLVDRDGDTVPDLLDRCDLTPLGARADASGCWILSDILFDDGKAEMPGVAIPLLDTIGWVLAGNPGHGLVVTGHADISGPPEARRKIAADRAQSVVDYLIGAGARPSQLQVENAGSTRPIGDSETEKGRARNRRVTFSVLRPEVSAHDPPPLPLTSEPTPEDDPG